MATKKIAKTETKKIAKEVPAVKEETKEVGFTDLELKIAKPTLNADKTMVIKGNFEELGSSIQKVVDKYKGTQLTEENVDYIKTLKKQFTSLRTGIERERKEYKKAYFDPAENLLDSMCKELLKIVDEGESALKTQLDAYDEKRKEELTIVLKEYVDDIAEKHSLRDEYKAQIVLKKEYYNKTQDEEESVNDIESQAVELEKKQKEYDTGVMLITAECEESGMIAEPYIRELQYKCAAEIIIEIKADKKASAELEKKAQEGTAVIGQETAELEAELHKAEKITEKQDEVRTRLMKVTYTASQAALMKDFFTRNGIKFTFIKTEF